jgi:pimeloyl-ACP methyl ester carboxylesterase
MGVQVTLETYSLNPKLFSGLFLLNGTYGQPFHTALGSPISRYLLPPVNQLIKKSIRHIQPHVLPIAERVISQKRFLQWVAKTGLIHKNLDEKLFLKVARRLLNTNLETMHHILDFLSKHSAISILPQIRVPTLIITSTADKLTPSHTAEFMSQQIPDCELMEIKDGSHYTLLEFPDLIVMRLKQFLNEHRL